MPRAPAEFEYLDTVDNTGAHPGIARSIGIAIRHSPLPMQLFALLGRAPAVNRLYETRISFLSLNLDMSH